MEPANINWEKIESRFVEDELYENINAPKWVDFDAPDEHVNDEAWFCKPDCRHPKCVEDFLRSTPPSKGKHSRTISENLPLRNRSLRDGNMKRGGIPIASVVPTMLNKSKSCKPSDRFQNQENENPNSTTLNHRKNIVKPGIEKKKPIEKGAGTTDSIQEEEPRRKLKSTLSASNLFGGRDIMSHITEFCSELKKLMTRAKERENLKKRSPEKKVSVMSSDDSLRDSDEKAKEIKPLLEVKKGDSEAVKKSNGKDKQRKLKTGDMENILLPKVKEESLLQVRTCPPSPQCFSAYREPPRKAKATTPLKPSKSIPAGKSIFHKVEQNSNRLETEEASSTEKASNTDISVPGKETKSLEMFWLLKPCTILDN